LGAEASKVNELNSSLSQLHNNIEALTTENDDLQNKLYASLAEHQQCQLDLQQCKDRVACLENRMSVSFFT
jgi:peptidoglycan hydrolase CwlO-like protein